MLKVTNQQLSHVSVATDIEPKCIGLCVGSARLIIFKHRIAEPLML